MKHTDILVINPGSTTTKIAVFRDMKVLFEETITHDPAKLKEMGDIFGQMEFREELIRETLRERGYDVKDLSAAVGRGGMIVGLCGGGYRVTPKLCQAMRNPDNPPHASSMGAELAYNIARPLGIPSFIYDSTMGCELTEVAKITGLEGIERYGCCHVLNSRAQAMKYALAQGKRYEELNLIVAHLGGGISVSAHQNGKKMCIRDRVSKDLEKDLQEYENRAEALPDEEAPLDENFLKFAREYDGEHRKKNGLRRILKTAAVFLSLIHISGRAITCRRKRYIPLRKD